MSPSGHVQKFGWGNQGVSFVWARPGFDQPRPCGLVPSSLGEFHPEPLTEPDVILSHHPAHAITRRLPPSAEKLGSSRHNRLAQVQRR